MTKGNENFFLTKKPWSIIKDNILGYYLTPYFSRILSTGKPINYFDCFAGKGIFDDGSFGSPIIALNALEEALRKTKTISPEVRTYFIESNYAEDLIGNLAGRNYSNVINGKFEEQIDQLLTNKENENIFLYIDPYGIKYLDLCWLKSLLDAGYSSVELLINFNSHGFFRVACNTMGVGYLEDDLDDIDDFDFYYYFKDNKNVDLVNKVAGGDYWKSIVLAYKEGRITGAEAEIKITKSYCQELRKHYKYVLDLPIRQKNCSTPKYRMIHATRHPGGCMLMVHTLFGQKEKLITLLRNGQLTLFNETADFNFVDSEKDKENLLNLINSLDQWKRKEEVYANFYVKYGLVSKPSDLDQFLQEFEEKNIISVKRNPPTTQKTQKPTKFYTENNKNKMFLRKG